MKLLKLFYLACAVFVIYYFFIILTGPGDHGPVWASLSSREDRVVDEIIDLIGSDPAGSRDRVNALLETASDETVLCLLLRTGYLDEDLEKREIVYHEERLAQFNAAQVLLIAKKMKRNEHYTAALVSIPTLLHVATQREGAPALLDLYQEAWAVFSHKKTKNRTAILNETLQWADAPTTLAFLRNIGVLLQTGKLSPSLLSVLPISTVTLILENLEGGAERAVMRLFYVGCVNPGYDGADHRSANILFKMAKRVAENGDDVWAQEVFAEMVARADGDVIGRFLIFFGYNGHDEKGMPWFKPEVLTQIPKAIREKMAEQLSEGHVTDLERRAALALLGVE